jgi:hypothetical protein
MKILLGTCALLLFAFLLSVPAEALQGKHLDSAISNVDPSLFTCYSHLPF